MIKKEREDDEIAFVRYMESVLPLDEVDETSGCLNLQWATAGSRAAEKGHDVEEEREDRDAAADGE